MQQELPSAPLPVLPFPKWRAILAGALGGVILRLIFFGNPGSPLDAMAGAFIYLAPVSVSAITIYFAERQGRQTWSYYFIAGMTANFLFVFGTLLILIEGLICAIVILPLFALIGGVTGVLIGALYRLVRWPTQTNLSLAVLPLVVALVPITPALPPQVNTIERSILIEAPAKIVWGQLLNIEGIRAEEVDSAVAFRIGVPPPLSATSATYSPNVRRIRMGKNVYFDQLEIERRDGEFIRWRQQFYEDSFPPGSFDQHVVMGGAHFDVNEVSYRLMQLEGATELRMSMHYRVSTHFNWYADWVARVVLGNLSEHLLELYETRAVAAVNGSEA